MKIAEMKEHVLRRRDYFVEKVDFLQLNIHGLGRRND